MERGNGFGDVVELKRKLSITPILCVKSVDRSIEYYKTRLGFTVGFRWSDDVNQMLKESDPQRATFASIFLEETEIFLSEMSQGKPGTWLCLNFEVKKDLDQFYGKIKNAGAIISGDMEFKPWGMHEVLVSDLDGHFLRFGAPAESHSS